MKIRHAGRKQLEAYSVKLDDCTVILSGIPERVISPNEMNYSFLQTGPNLAPTIELGWETGWKTRLPICFVKSGASIVSFPIGKFLQNIFAYNLMKMIKIITYSECMKGEARRFCFSRGKIQRKRKIFNGEGAAGVSSPDTRFRGLVSTWAERWSRVVRVREDREVIRSSHR